LRKKEGVAPAPTYPMTPHINYSFKGELQIVLSNAKMTQHESHPGF
jgi:hypothetical protein